MGEFLWQAVRTVQSEPFLYYLLDTGIAVSGIICVLLAVRPLMKRLPRAGMYALWLVLGLRLLCPFPIQGTGLFQSVLPEEVAQKVKTAGGEMRLDSIAARLDRQKQVNSGGRRNAYKFYTPEKKTKIYGGEAVSSVKSKTADTNGSGIAGEERASSAASRILLVWGAGFGACIFCLIVSLLRARLRLSDAARLAGNIYTHPLVANSLVVGIFRPRIYLSEKITEEERDYVLCHEQIHIYRHDYQIKPLMFAVCSVYWFNPLVWVAFRFMVKDMEVSCDEAVIRQMGEHARAAYSRLLLSLTVRQTGNLPGQTAFGAGELKDRIKSVMRYHRRSVMTTTLFAVCVAVAGCGVVSTPEATPRASLNAKGSGKYVEQSFSMMTAELRAQDGKGTELAGLCAPFILEGKIYILAADRRTGAAYIVTMKKGSQTGQLIQDSIVDIAKQYWGDKFKNPVANSLQAGADGKLYLDFTENSMPQKKYISDIDKYEKSFYAVHNHLLQIDPDTGGAREMPVKDITIHDMYKGKYDSEFVGTEKPVDNNEYSVFADGGILIKNGETARIYDGVTGEKRAEKKLDNLAHFVVSAGDGFFAYMVYDQATKTVSVKVCGEYTGEEEYEVDANAGYRDDSIYYSFGVTEYGLFIINHEGIFSAEYGSSKLEKTVDPDSDNVYYLADGETEFEQAGADRDGKFYVMATVGKGDTELLVYEPRE